MPRRLLTLLALATVPLALAACSGSDKGSTTSSGSTSGAANAKTTIDVTLSDSGCEPRSISATAGPTTFHVVNDGSAAVTEFEVLQGTRILGEVENVIPGIDRDFSVTLAAGSYTTKCPGGSSFEGGTLEVAGA